MDIKEEPMDDKNELVPFVVPAAVKEIESRGAREVEVKSNLFPINIQIEKIYKYRVDLTKITDKERDLTKGPKHDQATQARRRVTLSIFLDAFNKAKSAGTPLAADKYELVYDCANILYSVNPIEACKYTLLPEDISSSNSKIYLGEKLVQVDVTIQPVLTIETGNMDHATEVQQFIEIMASALVNKNGEHLVFKNKTFEKSSRNDAEIGEGKVVKSGNEKSCRVGEISNRPELYLQLDAKKSPFFAATSLYQFLMTFTNSRNQDELSRHVRKLNVQVRDLWVRTTHLKKHKIFAIWQLDKLTASTAKFVQDGKEITVRQYFEETYKIQLKYPHLPLVVERRPKGNNYYPVEVLEIERGQRVLTAKSTPSMGEKMIRECQLRPADMMRHIEKQLANLGLDDRDNKFMQAFKVKVDRHAQRAISKVLYPPAVKYNNQTVEPQRDGLMQWRLGGRETFACPAKLTSPFYFIMFDACCRPDDVYRFMDKMAGVARDHGMTIDTHKLKVKEMPSENDYVIEELFQKAKADGVEMIWAVTRMKLDPVHNTLKALEAKYGIVTQHVSQQVMQKAIGQQGAFMVLGNLISKTNPKLGGVNHGLTVSKAHLAANPADRQLTERVFAKGRMYIGLDVAHAGPQSFADRQLNVPQSEPSVVGMSYNTSNETKMSGIYWFQEPRLATVSRLERYTQQVLADYLAATGNLPEDIVVFRGGLSEGEFNKVAVEMQEMSKAFGCFDKNSRRGHFEPSVTVLVVQTSSNFRIVPTMIDERAKPMDQNLPSGTCVDSTITNPKYDEFIMVSQKALQGTARPIRCTVAYRHQGASGIVMSKNDLQILTHSLAFGHQTVAGSTTTPCFLYAATNLTKRGRNNWKTANFSDDTRSEVSGSSGGGKLRHDGSPDFFEKLSDSLKSSIKSHYWA